MLMEREIWAIYQHSLRKSYLLVRKTTKGSSRRLREEKTRTVVGPLGYLHAW